MMAFAMQSWMDSKMMQKMNCNHSKKDCKKICHNSDLKIKLTTFSNNNFSKKIVKVKIFSFVDISENYSKILENKNLIKNTSPPNIKRKIKYFSYLNLVKIIKSNT